MNIKPIKHITLKFTLITSGIAFLSFLIGIAIYTSIGFIAQGASGRVVRFVFNCFQFIIVLSGTIAFSSLIAGFLSKLNIVRIDLTQLHAFLWF